MADPVTAVVAAKETLTALEKIQEPHVIVLILVCLWLMGILIWIMKSRSDSEKDWIAELKEMRLAIADANVTIGKFSELIKLLVYRKPSNGG